MSSKAPKRSPAPWLTDVAQRVELELVNQTDVEISLNWIGHTRCEEDAELRVCTVPAHMTRDSIATFAWHMFRVRDPAGTLIMTFEASDAQATFCI